MELSTTDLHLQAVLDRIPPTPQEIENWLVTNLALVAELPREEIDVEDPITSLGVESLVLFSVAGDLASWLGHDISATLLWEYPTIRELAAHLGQAPKEENGQSQPELEAPKPSPPSSLVAIQPCGTRPPFYLVHEVGGTIWCYKPLASHMEPDQPLYGFEVPTALRQSSEPLCLKDLATLYVADLRAHQPNGPYLLGGFSMGGAIALEMARELREQNQEVALLALIDTYFPGLKLRSPSLPRKVFIHIRQWRDLDASQKAGYINERIEKLRRVLPSKRPTATPLLDAKKKWQEGNTAIQLHRAFTNYKVEPYDGVITLVSARTRYRIADELGAWRRVARGGVRQRFVPGSHGSIVNDPQVRHLAACLTRCLKKAHAPTT